MRAIGARTNKPQHCFIWLGLLLSAAACQAQGVVAHAPASPPEKRPANQLATTPEGLALIQASGAGDLAAMKLLLDKEVSPNAANENGITPLILAGYAGQLEAVQLLLTHNADPNQVNADQEAPLHTCAAHPRADQIVPLLLQKRARIDAVDKFGKIPLSNHAQMGNTGAVRALLDAGSKLEHRDNDQQTPLFAAALGGRDDTVTLLLARGAQRDSVNRFSATPLIAAAARGHLDVLQKLAAAGAKVDYRVPQGESALELAIAGDHVAVVTWLLDQGMDARGRGGDRPPLMIAAYKDGAKSIPLLVARGADPNLLVSIETTSISPLMGACAMDHEAAARALLEAGAKANLVGKGGANALHIAAVSGSLGCVQLLLAKGVLVDARNDSNGTPLRSASEGGHVEVVKLLLARGADRNVRDSFGLLPIDYARKEGHAAVVAALSPKN